MLSADNWVVRRYAVSACARGQSVPLWLWPQSQQYYQREARVAVHIIKYSKERGKKGHAWQYELGESCAALS